VTAFKVVCCCVLLKFDCKNTLTIVNVESDSDVGDAVGSTECQSPFRYKIIYLNIV
jgi:hypothetical protein